MKLHFILGILVAVVLLDIGWQRMARPSFVPGQVENQIRSFGAPVVHQLTLTNTFDRVEQQVAGEKIAGYRPQPEAQHAPAGLLPVEQQAWEAMAHRQQATESSLTPFFPERYSEGTDVRGQGMDVLLKPLGSTSARAQIENGKLVYHEAYPATDSLQVVSSGMTEELLLLRDARAPKRFEYEIVAASGVKEVTLRDNGIHFKSDKGRELQIEAPWLIEAGGRKMANRIHWELTPARDGKAWPKLALVVNDPKQLRYPVVIDPSWVAPIGQLNTGRAYHTATLLNNGQVLVVGGQTVNDYLNSAELYNPATGTWTQTGSLITARILHTATLLPNGKVLVAGGYNNGVSDPITAELYDPFTGKWSVTGRLNSSRYSHTATLLPNGQVLIAGGYDNSNNSHTTAELYNPATGIWTLTGSLIGARAEHTATLLRTGKVLVAGGYNTANGGITVTTAELYDPSSGTWTSTGNLITDRDQGTATLLINGQVLVAGGYSASLGEDIDLAELYDPVAGKWTATGSMTTERRQPTAILLPSGLVLVAGGYNLADHTLATTETYDPSTGQWTALGNLIDARVYDTATLLSSGQVLLAGGGIADPSDDINLTSVLSSSELYDPGVGTWSTTGSLNTARLPGFATLLSSGKVLVAGGANSSGSLAVSAELYDPVTGTWAFTGNLNVARTGYSETLLINGKVLVAGGINDSGFLNSVELYDPVAGTWALTGSLNTARILATATLLPNGKILVAGGEASNETALASAEIYDPVSETWTFTGSLNTARYEHTATLLSNGKVLVAGGFGQADASAEIYDPAIGTWTSTGNLNTGRYAHTATLLHSGKVLVTGGQGATALTSTELYDPITGIWTSTGSLNAARFGHSAILLTSGKVLVAGTEGVPSAETYDPSTEIWTVTGSLATSREQFGATLLTNGKILVSGGESASNAITSSELFDPGLGFTTVTQPKVNPLSNTGTFNLTAGSDLVVQGTGFTGVSEAYGGTTASSPDNAPVMQIESLVNEQTISLLANPNHNYNSTTFVSREVTGLPPGPALLTLLVNGTPSVSQYLIFNKLSQTITFPSVSGVVYGQKVKLAARASSGLAIAYSVISGPATVSGKAVTFTGVGSVVLAADQSGNGTYIAAPEVTQTVTVGQASQTITFPAISTKVYNQTFTPSATTSSGLAVSFSVISGPAMISADNVTLTGVGSVTLAANQTGNADYTAAPQVTSSFIVKQAAQTITFPSIGNQVYGAKVTLQAAASSGLPITYTHTAGVQISGNIATITGTGSITIGASQPGNTDYAAALEMRQTFIVSSAPQTITFPAIGNQTVGAKVTLQATASSGLSITYTHTAGMQISGNVATMTAAGSVTIGASQPGNTNYAAAPETRQTIMVTP